MHKKILPRRTVKILQQKQIINNLNWTTFFISFNKKPYPVFIRSLGQVDLASEKHMLVTDL